MEFNFLNSILACCVVYVFLNASPYDHIIVIGLQTGAIRLIKTGTGKFSSAVMTIPMYKGY